MEIASIIMLKVTILILFSICVTVDIISAIEFDKSGDHLATGDRGGRVVLFERTDTKEVSSVTKIRVIYNI